jgi:hypothetical protein
MQVKKDQTPTKLYTEVKGYDHLLRSLSFD